jgi:hypothetical protein|tara:strand:- start:448 stop:3822 length:3375 start_codon:yes stop_codon:yes gene_type:complete
MYKNLLFLLLLLIGSTIQGQTVSKDFRSKTFRIQKDTVQIETTNINSQRFKVRNKLQKVIDPQEYQIDFLKAILIIDSKKYTEITVEYFRFPEFVSKIYAPFDKNLIVPNNTNTGPLYSFTTTKKTSDLQLFEGLKTKGYLTRGVTSGNNQNTVTNSALDLEISGKISSSVNIRANIFDTNIPLQENGYSQNITDFDRIFIELYSDNWKIKAGDISLKNQESYFMRFNKQIAGLQVEATLNEDLNIVASGAVARGEFSTFTVVGVEGNQGPYKIVGPNNETAIVMVAGSESVYVNGVIIEAGENKAYTIDYNLSEITFNTTFPITNDMRIWIDFQYSDRNYTRFVTYEEVNYTSEKLNISGYFYSENDAKNQPLQQALSDNQKEILANAGNNTDLMVSESAFVDEYSENKILYKKAVNGAVQIFEYSTNPTDELYTVRFTNVGVNAGDYSLLRTVASGPIFEYVGIQLGNYNPIVKLIAPSKVQVFIVKSGYKPSEKMTINSEIALSNNDANLFSTIDDNQNTAIAAKIGWQQILVDKKWQLKSAINHEYVQQNFRTAQRWEPVEFSRDWNIVSNNATKNYFQSAFILQNKKNDFVSYRYNNLSYNNSFKGNKHEISSKLNFNKTLFSTEISLLENTSSIENNSFFRAKANVLHHFSKSWMGAFTSIEKNDRKDSNLEYINTSHQFKEYEAYMGIGDTAKVFAKFGVNFRNNDSIKSNRFTEINNRKTFYLNSKLIDTKKADLSVYANYRITQNNFTTDKKSLNSKIVYHQKLLNDFVNLKITYETSSGNVARQDYIYVKTEIGQGFYTWIDYNNDSVQDFDEFEIAQFQDQANYLRVPLPNLRFIATQRAKWQQSIGVNFAKWKNKNGFRKLLSHWSNQTFLATDNEQERIGSSFNFNPFDFDKNKLIGLNYNFRNQLYFNRNLQKYSTTFTIGNSKNLQQYFIGNQENNIQQTQIDFNHKFAHFWLLDLMVKLSENDLKTENFNSRNYEISAKEIQPKISFSYNKDHRFSAFYHFKNKVNNLQDFETLKQQKFGLDYFYISKKKNQISANATVLLNDFSGNINTPVAYQMLEGLQPGKNYTWNLLYSQKLNAFLNLNLSYLGRKSENSKIIHTGNIQLKALF